MDISKENTELRSEINRSEIQEFKHAEDTYQQKAIHQSSTSSEEIENAIKLSAASFESCDANELMHCYQIAIDFGVPTAQRALAMYQSKSLLKDSY